MHGEHPGKERPPAPPPVPEETEPPAQQEAQPPEQQEAQAPAPPPVPEDGECFVHAVYQ